nr:eukaryotic translation initiation factor 4 gamma 3-like isoform X1 [Aedes albopictus]
MFAPRWWILQYIRSNVYGQSLDGRLPRVAKMCKLKFRSCLITRCQVEFDNFCVGQNRSNCVESEPEEAGKTLAKEEIEKPELEEKRQSAIIRFIGKLYKHDMLSTATMHFCIKRQLEKVMADRDEIALKNLCRFLTAVGFTMEKKRWQDLGPILRHDGRNRSKSRRTSNQQQYLWILFRKSSICGTPGGCGTYAMITTRKKRDKLATTTQLQEDKINQSDRENSPGESTIKWLPSHLEQSDSLDTAQRDTQILFRKFRSVLNKLTLDNLFRLVDQVKSLVIDTDERLDGCVELLFQKAISEPMFAEAYARMCKEIGTIVVANDASKKRSSSFKSRLVNKCQDNFERCQGPKKEPFDDLKTQCEQTRQEVRRRYVGTVRIIGELYKIDQLTNSIMKSCIMQLLETESKDCSEEDLECLCVLLTTIGRKMEVDNGQNLGPYFEKLHDIFHNEEKYRLSRKIRFAIQDVMELRQIGWTTKQHSQDQRAAEPTRDYRGTVQRGSGRWINSGGRVYGRDNRAQSWRSGNRNPSVNLEQLLLNNIERDEVSRKNGRPLCGPDVQGEGHCQGRLSASSQDGFRASR